jgi:hypothetical protein
MDFVTAAFVAATFANVAPIVGRMAGHAQLWGALLLAMLAVPVVVQVFVRRRGFLIDTPWLAMLVFLIVLVAATLPARDAPTALAWITNYAIEGLLLYLLILNAVRSVRALRRMAWALVVTGAILAWMSAYQELRHDYKQQFAGFAQRNLERGPGGQVTGKGLHRTRSHLNIANRAAGPLGDPNRFAQMLLMALPLALYLAQRSRSRPSQIAACLCVGLLLAGVFLSYSRGGILALAVLVAASLGLRLLRWRQVLPAAVAGILLAIVIAPGTVMRLQTMGRVGDLLSNRNTATADGAVRGRMTEMLAALHVFMDHPVLGVGPGHFAPFYSIDYMDNPEIAFRPRNEPRRAHNLYLEIAAETGLVGLIAFMAIAVLLLMRLWRQHRRLLADDPAHANLAAAFGLMVLSYLTTGIFLQLAFQRYFWMAAALAGATIQILARRPLPAGEPLPAEPPPSTAGDVLQSMRAPAI